MLSTSGERKLRVSCPPYDHIKDPAQHLLRLLNYYERKKELRAALKAELQFQKLVLNHKSPWLKKVTGSLLAVANKLVQFLGGEPLNKLATQATSKQPSRAHFLRFRIGSNLRVQHSQ